MQTKWIQNYGQLATTPERNIVLALMEVAYSAIDTETVIRSEVSLAGDILTINHHTFDLSRFKRVLVLGFGKASGKAALALEQVLGDRITAGVVISPAAVDTKIIRSLTGAHPIPSYENVDSAREMALLIENMTEEDLALVLVSGGGSALLCWTKDECDQQAQLYEAFLKTGEDIKALNTIRKHISEAKGGGLAKLLYPATVVGLIFSDVPGNNYHLVDSGPTYRDYSTVEDAQRIIQKYQLGAYTLTETPKDPQYFERVFNIPVVSNTLALKAMAKAAEGMGLPVKIISSELLDTPENTIQTLEGNALAGTVLLAGSEVKLNVPKNHGKGGRNSYLALRSLGYLDDDDTFASFASDGVDNSEAAGAIVDAGLLKAARTQNLDIDQHLNYFDSFTFFDHLGDGLIYTGPTEANISDLLIWYRK